MGSMCKTELGVVPRLFFCVLIRFKIERNIVNMNPLDFLKERISSDLAAFFPNISIDKLEVLKQDDLNTITVSLNYSVINTNISDTLEIDFT